MYYIDVIKVYGDQMQQEHVVLKITNILRTLIDRNKDALHQGVEPEFNHYLSDKYPFQMVFVDSDPNSVRNWSTLAQHVSSYRNNALQ